MEMKIGARMTDDGAEFFGMDALNKQLAEGAQVTNIAPGDALLEPVEEEEGAYSVAGFEMVVTLTDAPQ